MKVLPSLDMEVIREDDGSYTVIAPWLTEPVNAPTWEEVYWNALSLYPR